MKGSPRTLILRNRQSPGDIVMLTAAVRDRHRSHPGRFVTDVRTPCPALWEHNPHITPISDDAGETIDCEYPLIHRSNSGSHHFLHGFMEDLGRKLGVRLEPSDFRGDIHVSAQERRWMPQVMEITGWDTPFWIVTAGGKWDFTIKWWDAARYQQVIDAFRGRIQFVQVGERGHWHPPLDGVIDLRGKTTLRQLVRLVYHAQGALCPVTALMHLAAAVPVRPGRPKNRACVVVAGGREPAQWEAYPHHQYIHTNGALRCCDHGGCWRSRTAPLGDGDPRDGPAHLCHQPVAIGESRALSADEAASPEPWKLAPPTHLLPRCMDMISAAEVIARIERYYLGGALEYLSPKKVLTGGA